MNEKIQFACDHVQTDTFLSALNKNVISVNIRSILSTESSIKFKMITEMKISCTRCGGILSYLSKKSLDSELNEWICELCGNVNETNILDWDALIEEDDIEFISLDDDSEEFSDFEFIQTGTDEGNERIIVFCIDTSGSMAGPRINSVKKACLKTIELLCSQENSEFKLALITFDSNSKYYGNGSLNEATISKDDWFERSDQTISKMRKYADELLTIKASYESFRRRIEVLDADGGTNICDALAHSVLLASASQNSFIILCTDGCAADSDETFYKSIINYCNERLIKINMVSFEGADCNLSMLGQCSCETGGKIYRTILNGSDLDAHFIDIIEENLKDCGKFKGEINVKIVADLDHVTISNATNQYCIDNYNPNTLQEILLEFDYKPAGQEANSRTNKDYIVFQTQIKTYNSLRILTTKLSVGQKQTEEARNQVCNEHILHVYNLKKLSRLVLENKNMIVAKEYLKLYERFVQSEATCRVELSDVVVKLINRLPAKQNFRYLNDFDAQILYNNKNLTVAEFLENFTTREPILAIGNTVSSSQTNQLELFKSPGQDTQHSVNIADNIQFTNHLQADERSQKVLNKHSLKMIMVALKMIKEATSICMKARNILNLNHMQTAGKSPKSKSKEFLRTIFENISRTEAMVNALSKSSSVLINKDLGFLNKMFEELNVYLELDLLGAMQPIQMANF